MTWSIGNQLKLIGVLGLTGVLALSAIAWVEIGAVYRTADFGTANTVPSMRELGDAGGALATLDHDLWLRLNAREADASGLDTRVNDGVAKARAALARYSHDDMDEPAELFGPDKAGLDRSIAAMEAYLSMVAQARALIDQKDIAGAREWLMAHQDLHRAFAEALMAQRQFNMDFAGKASQEAKATFERVKWIVAGLGVLVALAMLILVEMTRRAILHRIDTAKSVADSIAAGDLATRVHDAGADELGRLLASLEMMRANLTRIVRGVLSNAEGVATASSEIAQGNQDLSGRTEQKAAALEQTAATMDHFGSTIRQNAGNANQANQLAQAASSIAERGGEAVDEMVQTMRQINQSSAQIAEIIGVIDGIAFQTNILALNASVEAARAGEQGRGFAVAAGEVRALAQRSAQAAQQIKALITESVTRAERGSGLADQTGKTMSEVLESIRRVTDIVSEISAASDEQRSGVSQVSEAVTQIDQTTQQNAALVEQSAAAATSLKSQADELVRAVGAFRLAAA
jgi:methyl-accepting chemotaxis protein